MDLKDIMLSKISQTERQTAQDFTYMWNPRKISQYKNKKPETDSQIQRNGGYQRGREGGMGKKIGETIYH